MPSSGSLAGGAQTVVFSVAVFLLVNDPVAQVPAASLADTAAMAYQGLTSRGEPWLTR